MTYRLLLATNLLFGVVNTTLFVNTGDMRLGFIALFGMLAGVLCLPQAASEALKARTRKQK